MKDSISLRLVLGFSLIMILVVLMCAFTLWATGKIGHADREVSRALNDASSVQETARRYDAWLSHLNETQASLNALLAGQGERILENAGDVRLLADGEVHPLQALLDSETSQALQAALPESRELLGRLQDSVTAMVEVDGKIAQVWQQRHDGLAEALNDLKRSEIYWALKVANMLFVKSTIGELLDEELVDTDLEEFAAGKTYRSYAETFPALAEAIDRARPVNERLWNQSYKLNALLMSGQWEKARELYRDEVPTAIKSMVVDLDSVLQQENRILHQQGQALQLWSGEMKPLKEAATTALTDLRELVKNRSAGEAGQVTRRAADVLASRQVVGATIDRTRQLNILLTLAALAVGALGGWRITRSITRPLAQTVDMIRDLDQGRLEKRLRMTRGDEIGEMARMLDDFADHLQHEVVTSFERLAAGDFTFSAQGLIREPLSKANASLNALMRELKGTGQQLATGSAQIADSSQDLSSGAARQAHSVEEITRSMTEMAAQTRNNAEMAQKARELTGQAHQSAQRGNTHIREMVQAMREVNEAGESISKIIKVIDEIAFQTNLLALNAAVEAARAGGHGKGFAVVAEEVRNLAGRSAKAAGETAELIAGAVSRTQNGARVAEQAATVLAEIVDEVTRAATLVADIAAASRDQAQRIDQVNGELGEIDRVTQRSASGAEQSAAAAAQLSDLAGRMRDLLERFVLEGGDGENPQRPVRVMSQAGMPGPTTNPALPVDGNPTRKMAGCVLVLERRQRPA